MNVELLLQALREVLSAPSLDAEYLPIDETCIAVPAECLRRAVDVLVGRFRVTHLSTITAEDTGLEIVLLYHFWDRRGLTLRTSLPRDGPHIASLARIIPGAIFYEQEVAEMLGVVFDGHPVAASLLLPDDWEGPPPLRRPTGDDV